jgi:hypothetical protein
MVRQEDYFQNITMHRHPPPAQRARQRPLSLILGTDRAQWLCRLPQDCTLTHPQSRHAPVSKVTLLGAVNLPAGSLALIPPFPPAAPQVSTVALLRAMNAAGVGKLIFSSSCATFGAPTEFPITEQTPQRPTNPYGAAKLQAEQAIIAQVKAQQGTKK